MNIRISLGIKFHSEQNSFEFLDQVRPERVILVKSRKTQHQN